MVHNVFSLFYSKGLEMGGGRKKYDIVIDMLLHRGLSEFKL